MDEIDDVPLISINGYALSHEEVMRMVKEVEDEFIPNIRMTHKNRPLICQCIPLGL